MASKLAAAVALLGIVPPLLAQEDPADGPSRGRLLYEAHCIQCHTTKMHWRDARVARDWGSLRGQVQAWQMRIGERWSADDVDAVARHLNATIYHYPVPSEHAAAGGTVAFTGR